jgi:hypothetical protein
MERSEEEPGDEEASSMTEAMADLGAVEPAELDAELGVTPEECLLRLVDEHDGRLAQEALGELVPWSAATVSRLLSALEEDQQLMRLHAGRGKTVFLPERTPDGDPVSER